MGYNEKIMEVRNDISNKNYESAISKLQNMLYESNNKTVEDENNTYYTFGNNAEQVIFYNTYGYKKPNIFPEYNISEIYYYLGFANTDLKNYGLALEHLNNALKWNPINVSAMFEKAAIFRLEGDLERYRAEVEKTYVYIYNSNYLALFYRDLGWYFIERELLDLGNALYTYSQYFYKTDTAENELKYIAQKKNRDVIYTPRDEINNLFRDYNIPLNFNARILNCINNELKYSEEQKNYKMARYFSNIMFDMTLGKEFVWYEPLKNEQYGIQIDKPDNWSLITKDLYERYGLKENVVFAFRTSQIGIYTVTYVDECTINQFEDKFNKIVENFVNTGTLIINKSIKLDEKICGRLFIETHTNGNTLKYNKDFVIINNKLFEISWQSANEQLQSLDDTIGLNVENTIKIIDTNDYDAQDEKPSNTDSENTQTESIESQINKINDEYAKNGINLTIYNLLNNFSKTNLKNDSNDPFWKGQAVPILNAIIILILTDKNKVSIEDLKEKSENIEKLRKYCEDNLAKLDIAKIQQFADLMEGITYIRKSESDKTFNSLLELINKSF